MSSGKEEAKELFFAFSCNRFFMWHDGVLEKFERFGISESELKMWTTEYISLWVGKLSKDDLTPVDKLRNAWAVEALPELMAHAMEGDSFAKLWYANAIWDLAKSDSVPVATRERAVDMAISLWRSLAEGPLELTEGHRAEITPQAIRALDATTPEEYVANYANGKLIEAEHWSTREREKVKGGQSRKKAARNSKPNDYS